MCTVKYYGGCSKTRGKSRNRDKIPETQGKSGFLNRILVLKVIIDLSRIPGSSKSSFYEWGSISFQKPKKGNDSKTTLFSFLLILL